jgi:hypothetical protein
MDDIWQYGLRFLLGTWSMDMCYDVDYISTTIARIEPMIEIIQTLLKEHICSLNRC